MAQLRAIALRTLSTTQRCLATLKMTGDDDGRAHVALNRFDACLHVVLNDAPGQELGI